MGDERKFGIGQFVRKKQPHAQLPKLAVICRKREAHIDTNTKQKNRSKSMSKSN